jgi:hypothetical protein
MSKAKVSSATASPSAQPMDGSSVARKSGSGRPRKFLAPVSRDAQRLAAAILEVLAGVRTPTEAAAALSLSLPRYYLWEQRALEGLVRACEPRPMGRAAQERHQIAVLEKEVVRLRQDCTRQQSLVRASQRTMGLAASPSPAKPTAKSGGKATAKAGDGAAGKAKRKRRPVARALIAAAALQALPGPEIPADSSSPNVAEAVEWSLPISSLAAAEAAPAAAAVSET